MSKVKLKETKQPKGDNLTDIKIAYIAAIVFVIAIIVCCFAALITKNDNWWISFWSCFGGLLLSLLYVTS